MSVVKKTLDIVLRGAGVTFIGLIGLSAYSSKNPAGSRVLDRELKRIMFEDEESASRVLKRLRERAQVHATVSAYELCDLINFEGGYQYANRLWGWDLSDLQGAKVYRDGDIWRIKFPKVSRLDALVRSRRINYNA